MKEYSNLNKESSLNSQEILETLDLIRENLNSYIVTLNAKDRMKITKMGNDSKLFVKQTLDYMEANPEFISTHIKSEEIKAKFELVQSLLPIFREIKQISQTLDDTMMAMGSDLMMAANDYYSSVKRAKKLGIPNAQPIFEELKTRYVRKANRNSDNS